ncbi:MAG: 2-phosphosulfolactate phosphatase [Thermodesulfobacteriota bacterium]
MKIEIRQCLAGAEQAEGVVVIVDVFRSGNTSAVLLDRGAPFIRPVAELEEARALKNLHPDWLLVGERDGIKPDDFDINNSPTEAFALETGGRPVILSTSAGTYGLAAAAPRAELLLMATLINARAAADIIRTLQPDLVTLVAIGSNARQPASEDDLAAAFLADLILDRRPDYNAVARGMLKGSGADRLRQLGQWRDLAWCLRLDRLNLVPEARLAGGDLVLRPYVPAGGVE